MPETVMSCARCKKSCGVEELRDAPRTPTRMGFPLCPACACAALREMLSAALAARKAALFDLLFILFMVGAAVLAYKLMTASGRNVFLSMGTALMLFIIPGLPTTFKIVKQGYSDESLLFDFGIFTLYAAALRNGFMVSPLLAGLLGMVLGTPAALLFALALLFRAQKRIFSIRQKLSPAPHVLAERPEGT